MIIKASDLVDPFLDTFSDETLKILENEYLIELICKYSVKQYLESIWHPSTEKPTKPIIIGKFKDALFIGKWDYNWLTKEVMVHNGGIGPCAGFRNIEKWCYIDAILPKNNEI